MLLLTVLDFSWFSFFSELGADNTTLRIMNFANDTKVDPDGKLIGDPTETALVQDA